MLVKRWLLFGLLLICHIYFLQNYRHFISPNELSRLLLTSAIVDDHTFTIDSAIERYGNTQDKAAYRGRYYSDKAIGTSILSIPPFLLMRATESIAGIRFSVPMALFWVRVFTVTIPALLFVHILLRFWIRLRPGSAYTRQILFLHLFGTIAFTYSSLFVSQYLLGIALFASAFYLNEYRIEPNQDSKYAWFAGIYAAISLLLEYPAVFPVAILCVSALFVLRNGGRLLRFGLPLTISVLLILGYNNSIFGTPWDVTYRHMTHSFHTAQHAQGFIGIGWPKAEAIYGLLFSRHHGLFFLSPFLILCVPGFYRMLRSTDSFPGKLFLAITVTVILFYSGFSYWIAGWNFGPRYLTPLLPFLSTTAFYFTDEFLEKGAVPKILLTAAAIWSVMCVTIGTITFPFPPDNLRDIVFFLNFPLLLSNATGKNLAGNAWFFFPLLLITYVLLTHTTEKLRMKIPAAAAVLAASLFAVAFLTIPRPSAMEYYARGSVYLYLGYYTESFHEMQLALTANPDARSRALIERRMSDLRRLLKQ